MLEGNIIKITFHIKVQISEVIKSNSCVQFQIPTIFALFQNATSVCSSNSEVLFIYGFKVDGPSF